MKSETKRILIEAIIWLSLVGIVLTILFFNTWILSWKAAR